jgi:hypothetical protein
MSVRSIPSLRRCALATAVLSIILLAGCGGGDNNDGNGPPPFTPDLTNVLRIDDAAGAAGAAVAVSFRLENTSSLTGLQFDLGYDAALLSVTAAGAGARAADFDAQVNEIAGGLARVILVDLDGTSEIPPGDGIVVTATVQVANDAAAGTSSLRVTSATGVNGESTTVPLGGSSATFTVR